MKLLDEQKQIIREFYEDGSLDKNNENYYGNYNEMYKMVEEIRDCETLPQDIRRYIEEVAEEIRIENLEQEMYYLQDKIYDYEKHGISNEEDYRKSLIRLAEIRGEM